MNSTAEGNLHSSHMKAHDEGKQQLHEVLADYSADVYSAVEVESGDDVKVKVAIGFAVTCAVLLFAIFILLLYKVLWFKSRSNASSKSTQRVVSQPRAPSVTERSLKTSRQQRRHAPLMRSDSSVSEIGLDSLSKNNNFSSTSTENSLNLGQLEFEVHYDTDTEVLRVKIVTARNLPANHSTNYVEIYLLPDRVEKHQTKIRYSNCNPVYNEEFEFDVGYSELSERTLQCCLFSFDGFSRHQSIGEVFYSFGEDDQFNESTSVSLCKEIKRDLFLLKEESPNRVGEVLVSLCYLPTTNRLTFVVLKARISKNAFPEDLPNPVVKVSLMLAGRQMKKTKTSVAKNTLYPVYNEAFVFDVPLNRLSDVSLLVRVLDSTVDEGERAQVRTIGKSVVGPDSQTSIGLHHWNCMMTTPRKPIAQWHPLLKS